MGRQLCFFRAGISSLGDFHTSRLVPRLTEEVDSQELDLNIIRFGPFTLGQLELSAVPLLQALENHVLLPTS
ncbi:hypothetical protein TNCV_2169001 [Trichonephila clavipes]|nr:hypothetical protein TNCV_2169001 [Trichonephila clavipes]